MVWNCARVEVAGEELVLELHFGFAINIISTRTLFAQPVLLFATFWLIEPHFVKWLWLINKHTIIIIFFFHVDIMIIIP